MLTKNLEDDFDVSYVSIRRRGMIRQKVALILAPDSAITNYTIRAALVPDFTGSGHRCFEPVNLVERVASFDMDRGPAEHDISTMIYQISYSGEASADDQLLIETLEDDLCVDIWSGPVSMALKTFSFDWRSGWTALKVPQDFRLEEQSRIPDPCRSYTSSKRFARLSLVHDADGLPPASDRPEQQDSTAGGDEQLGHETI